jgi:CDGSH-type Zn-finger protein
MYKQPFCDDAHEGTKFEPLNFTIDKKQKYYLICGW